MASIREQIVSAIITALNTSRPNGVPVAARARMEAFIPEELPAITVKPVREEIEHESQGKRFPYQKRILTLRVSVMVAGAAAADGVDALADPMLVWATSRLSGQHFPTLMEECIEALNEWEYAAEDQPYMAVHQDFRIEYHTLVGDQTAT